MAIQTLCGIASHVRHTTCVEGGDQAPVATAHTELFRIDSMQVLLSAMPMVSDGDRMLVVGSWERGVFEAVGYRNLTTQACAFPGYGFEFGAAVLFLVACWGCFGFNFALLVDDPMQAWMRALGAAFGLLGLYCLVGLRSTHLISTSRTTSGSLPQPTAPHISISCPKIEDLIRSSST